MIKKKKKTDKAALQCTICNKPYANSKLRAWITIRPSVSELIKKDYPDWDDGDYICRKDLANYRSLYAQKLLEKDRGINGLSELDTQVIASIQSGEMVSVSPQSSLAGVETLGDRMADRVATFGGSWIFILSFCTILIIWMVLNVTAWLFKPYDPYPFILLNLLLSCVAAMQAPIIMMSQRRQDIKDRVQAENDYRVNLKAELEIRQLNEKFDHQMMRQWQRLAELHQIQIDILHDRSDN